VCFPFNKTKSKVAQKMISKFDFDTSAKITLTQSTTMEEVANQLETEYSQFKELCPVTFDRLNSAPYQSAVETHGIRLPDLFSHLQNSHNGVAIWKQTLPGKPVTARALCDEFGADSVYQSATRDQKEVRKCSLGYTAYYDKPVTQRTFELPGETHSAQLWSVPFQELCLALLNATELVLVHMHEEDKSEEMQDWRR
jgi:hypothetical protein